MPRLLSIIPWVFTAVALLAAAWLAERNLFLRSENQSRQTEHDLIAVALKMSDGQLRERTLLAESLINDLGRQLALRLDLSHLQVIALVPQPGCPDGAKAILILDTNRQTGLLVAEKLPAPSGNQEYQLWILDPEPRNTGAIQLALAGGSLLSFQTLKPIPPNARFALGLEQNGLDPPPPASYLLLGR